MQDFPNALNKFFDVLDIPTHGIIKQPGPLEEFLNPDKVIPPEDLLPKVGDVYLQGMVDKKAFQGEDRDTDLEDLKEKQETD